MKPGETKMHRRRAPFVIASASVAVAGLAIVAALMFGRDPVAPRLSPGTNVVIITLDTVRADRLTPYGFTGIQTPALQQMGQDGVVFEHAYSSAPLTFPAHASLFTGLNPKSVGVRDNSGFRVNDQVPTLAEAFKRLQYRTAAFVSAFVLDGRGGLNRGFARYRDEFDVRVQDLAAMAAVQRSGEETWTAARSWLGESTGTPFFLWLHFYDAHAPYEPPEPFRSRYPATPYEAEVAYVDSLVGQVLAELDRLSLTGRTLVVVAGDHGEGLGEHGEDEHGLLLYDSTLRVPMLVRFPDRRYAGTRVQRAVGLVDLFPSLLELFDQPLQRPVDGHSFLTSLEHPDAIAGPPLVAETLYPRLQFGWSGLESLRTDRFKLIRGPKPELYDYRADAREAHDRSTQLGEDLVRLDAQLTAANGAPGALSATTAPVDGGTVAALRSLGYVAGGADPAGSGPLANPVDKVAAHRRLMTARAALDRGDEAAGLTALETLLDDEPDFEAAHASYRDYFIGRRRAADAARRLQSQLARRPKDAHLLRDLAEAQRALGRRREAIASLNAALSAAPDFVPAMIAAADLLAEEGQLDAARQQYERALALSPGVNDLAMKLARTHLQLGQVNLAERLIDAALADRSDVSGAHYLRALIAEQQGSAARAEAEYRAELALHPWDFQTRFNLARLISTRGAFAEQIELLDSIPALAPDFADVHFYRAKAYLDSGDPARRQAAVDAALLGLRLAPDSSTAPLGHYVLADIYELQGRREESIRQIALGRALEARQRRP